MNTGMPLSTVSYFGKLPSRGDFVRSADNHQLMARLDRWAGGGVELLAQNVAWKTLYDQSPPMHFAFLGSRSRAAIAGHFLPSRDATGRRFPFLSAICLDAPQPVGFIRRSPLALARLWSSLARLGRQAMQAADAGEPLRELADSDTAVNSDPATYEASFVDFLEMQDIGALQTLLRQSGHARMNLHWVLPALGLLMQPLLTSSAHAIDKALALPLPRDPLYQPLVATWWMDLIGRFVERADFELALLIKEGPGPEADDAPRLIVGFQGADGGTLHAALDPQVADERIIRIDDAAWVEDQRAGDYALNRLASYLERDALSLQSASRCFGETFLGT